MTGISRGRSEMELTCLEFNVKIARRRSVTTQFVIVSIFLTRANRDTPFCAASIRCNPRFPPRPDDLTNPPRISLENESN